MVKNLVHCGVSINAKDNHGCTALMWAAGKGHLEVVRYLVEQGANKETKDMMHHQRYSDLNSDTSRQMPTLSIKSVSSGRYLDGRNPGMSDPLLSAGERNPVTDAYLQWIIGDTGNGRKFIKSVSSGQYLDGRNPGMSDPLLSAGERNPVTDAYLQWVIGDTGNGRKFIKSVSSGQYLDGRNPGMSDPLLSAGERNPVTDAYLQWVIEAKNDYGWTALMWAADSGHLGVVRYLVEQGVDKEARNNVGNTALMSAVQCGHLDVVWYLVGRGADKEAKDNYGRTVLIWAADRGYLDVVRYLVEQGANKEARDNDGNTALMRASKKRHLDVVRYFEGDRDPNGRTALMQAACNGQVGLVRYLVERGADKEAKDNNGRTALIWAAQDRHLDVVRYLVKKHVNKEAKDNNNRTALIKAALYDHVDVVRYLIQQGADIRTALEWAAQRRRLNVIWHVVEQGAHVRQYLVELDAETSCLHNQENSGLVQLLNLNIGEDKILPFAKLLLEYGAPPRESNKHGESAKSISKAKGYHLIAALVDEYADKSRQKSEMEDKEREDQVRKDPKWFISPDAVKKIDGVLGRGSSGKVYRAKWAYIDVAVKEISVVDIRQFMEEVYTWCDLRHLYVVQFYGANHRNEPHFIVSKHASRGELIPYLKGEGKTVIWRKLREVAAGLSYLHYRGVVHGDLRGDNIVVSDDGTAMLTDFGLSFSEFGSCPLEEVGDTLGAMQWRAPEIAKMAEEKPTCKSDVFSLGMCIIEAVKGAVPWGENLSSDKIRQIYRGGKFEIDKPYQLEKAQWDLVKRMIAFTPDDRPDMVEVVSTLEQFAEDEECPPFVPWQDRVELLVCQPSSDSSAGEEPRQDQLAHGVCQSSGDSSPREESRQS